MKKTISINIKGLNFIIEEDAYQQLQEYLEHLKLTLQNQEGSDEIIEDIELRIAELFSEKLNESKAVVELSDVEEILALLGRPEDYIDAEDDENKQNQRSSDDFESSRYEKADKRLYRDTENASVGGVCGGLANYLNIDRVIIRAIFVLMVLFAGFGVSLYIILWIIIPKASSSIDRLRMKGKPITVESVKEEVRNASDNISKNTKRASKAILREELYQNKISRAGRILGSLVGGFLILIGISFLIPYLIFVVGGFEFIPIDSENGYMNFSEFGELVLNNDSDYFLLQIAIILGGFSTILFFFLLGGQLITRLKSKWMKPTLIGLFSMGLVGLILGIIVGVRTGRDLTISSSLETSIGEIKSQEMTILPYDELFSKRDQKYKRSSNGSLITIKDENIVFSGIDIKYVHSDDSLFRIKQIKTASGISGKMADTKCENIHQDIQLKNDTLYISPNYSFPTKDKIRNQEIEILIEVPLNGIVHLPNEDLELKIDKTEHDEDEYVLYKRNYLKANGNFKNRGTRLGYK